MTSETWGKGRKVNFRSQPWPQSKAPYIFHPHFLQVEDPLSLWWALPSSHSGNTNERDKPTESPWAGMGGYKRAGWLPRICDYLWFFSILSCQGVDAFGWTNSHSWGLCSDTSPSGQPSLVPQFGKEPFLCTSLAPCKYSAWLDFLMCLPVPQTESLYRSKGL